MESKKKRIEFEEIQLDRNQKNLLSDEIGFLPFVTNLRNKKDKKLIN